MLQKEAHTNGIQLVLVGGEKKKEKKNGCIDKQRLCYKICTQGFPCCKLKYGTVQLLIESGSLEKSPRVVTCISI